MTEEALQDEQQAVEATPTLRETLEAARDELAAEETVDEVTEEVEDEAVEEEATEIVDTEEEVEEETEEDLEAPKEWSEEEKDAFASIYENDPEAAKLISDRYTNMHKGFHEKAQELSQLKRDTGGISKLFDSRQNEMQRNNVTQEGVIQKLLGWDTFITENPIEAITALAKQNGIDLTELAFGGDEEDSYEDEAITSLKAEIQELKAKNSNDEEQRATAKNESMLTEAREFAGKTDKDGNLSHPYCADVQQEMATLLLQGKSFADAYEAAIWTNPEVREKLMNEAPKKAESIEDKRAKIARAKKAGKSVTNSKGRKSAVKPTENLTMREELKKNFAAMST